MSSIFKNAIAAAFMKLCTEKDMADITTKDITDTCGISRQTFYNHFHDKYEVMSYLFDEAAQKATEPLSEGYGSVYSAIVTMLKYAAGNRNYYTSIARLKGQNSFEDYFCTYSIAYYSHVIRQYYGEEALTPEIHFDISFNCHAVTREFMTWILTGMKEAPEQLALYMTNAMPEQMKKLLNGISSVPDEG